MPSSSKHANDVTFTEDSLVGFIKKIHNNIGDNYHFVSTSDMAEKRAGNANYVFTGYEKEIEDAFPASNNTVGWNKGNIAKICIINNEFPKGATLNSDANRNSGRYTWVRGGSLLKFETEIAGKTKDNRPNGTIWIDENNGTTLHAVKVKGFDNSGNFDNSNANPAKSANGTASIGSDIIYAYKSLGSTSYPVPTAYITNLGTEGKPVDKAYIKDLYITTGGQIHGTPTFSGALTITNTTQAKRFKTSGTTSPYYETDVTASQVATIEGSIVTYGGIAAKMNIMGYKIFGAVFNDYAEYRQTDSQEPGRCVIEIGDGNMTLSSKRLQAGANIVSDTFGFSIGETYLAQTPIAVCGRVLAYPLEDKQIYEPGDAVCSGPNGTISKMTREEIREWPDRIVGYVSEIPNYEIWGSDQVEVNGRIWIKIK